jgi:replicative DNA helicase
MDDIQVDTLYNQEAEQAVLGSLIIDESKWYTIDLKPEDFFIDANAKIFKAMVNLNGRLDPITVTQELSRMNLLEEIGGAAYIYNLIAHTPTSENCGYYAGIVKEFALNRKIISAGYRIMALGQTGGKPSESLLKAQQILYSVGKETIQHDTVDITNVAKETADFLGQLRTKPMGLLTGFDRIDEKIGGIQRGEFVIIAGNPSIGKTSLALQIARNMSALYRGLIITLEMTPLALMIKMIASESGISSRVIYAGNYPDYRLDALINALGNITKHNIRINQCNTTIAIRNVVERELNDKGLDFICIDYLQKIRDRHGNNENSRIGFISGELASMTKDYNIPIMCLSQLSRGNLERENKRPQLSDLRDSGSIEQDADMVWSIYRESYFQDKKGGVIENNTTELNIIKNRLRGNTGVTYLKWEKDHERYICKDENKTTGGQYES